MEKGWPQTTSVLWHSRSKSNHLPFTGNCRNVTARSSLFSSVAVWSLQVLFIKLAAPPKKKKKKSINKLAAHVYLHHKHHPSQEGRLFWERPSVTALYGMRLIKHFFEVSVLVHISRPQMLLCAPYWHCVSSESPHRKGLPLLWFFTWNHWAFFFHSLQAFLRTKLLFFLHFSIHLKLLSLAFWR